MLYKKITSIYLLLYKNFFDLYYIIILRKYLNIQFVKKYSTTIYIL